jgi:hypothetical protein
MNIIPKAGLAITTNKDSVKAILDKYKIPYGKGSLGEVIKAVFTGIKSGNKDLATDIAGLIQANQSSLKSKISKIGLPDKIAKIFSQIHLSKKTVAVASQAKLSTGQVSVDDKKPSYADGTTGDPVADTALQLISEVNSTDVDTATSVASSAKASDFDDSNKKMIAGVLIVIAISAIIYFMTRNK